MESTLIRIDLDLHRLVKIEATKDGKSIQAWVSDILRRELEARVKQQQAIEPQPPQPEPGSKKTLSLDGVNFYGIRR